MTRHPMLAALLLLTTAVVLPLLFVAWFGSTIAHLPPSGDADRWWSCTDDTIADPTTPPACLDR